MSNVASHAKAHEAHAIHPKTVSLKRPIFNNGPIHIRAADSETGEDTFLDWGESVTLLRHDVIALTEGFQHCDPDQVRIALHSVEKQLELLKKYLVARDVIDPA